MVRSLAKFATEKLVFSLCVTLLCFEFLASHLKWSIMRKRRQKKKQSLLSDSLRAQIKYQPQPSEQKEYILRSSNFRCVTCLHRPVRCPDCISIVSIATKEYSKAKTKIENAIRDYEISVSSESSFTPIRDYLAKEENQKIRDSLANVRLGRGAIVDDISDARSRLLEVDAVSEGLETEVQNAVQVNEGLGVWRDALQSVPVQEEAPLDEDNPVLVDILVWGLRVRDAETNAELDMGTVSVQEPTSMDDDYLAVLDELIED